MTVSLMLAGKVTGNVQDTHGECQDDHRLVYDGGLQAPDDPDWNGQDDQLKDSISDCNTCPSRRLGSLGQLGSVTPLHR